MAVTTASIDPGSLVKTKKPWHETTPVGRIIQARDAGDIDDAEMVRLLHAIGPQDVTLTNGRCHHLGPYPDCRGGCNR